MKNRYFVINKQGKLIDPIEYIKSNACSDKFKIFIQREALDESVEDKNNKPEYLKYANKLGFNWEPNADIGFVQYDHKACLIIRLVQDYARQLVNNIGFPIYEVRGSNVFDMSHPVVKAYAKLYGDRLFQFNSGKKKVVMSYDASYPQFNLAKKYRLSYKDLPFSHFSISDCYRHEQSGECMLLYRQRRFFMPDLHPYFRNVNEAFAWYPKIEKQILQAVNEVNRKYQVIAEVGSIKDWKNYKEKIINIAKNSNKDILVEIHRDNKDRYWIINVDYKIIDKLKQSREIACIQIDIGNAKRLGIEYIDKNNKAHHPAIIHSAVPGGIERYLYMLFDNFEESFPLWLHPMQIRLIPVSDDYAGFCLDILEKNQNKPIRIDIDDRSESVSKRIKRAKEELIPYAFVIGKKEINDKGNISELNAAINSIVNNAHNKPFINYNWPRLVSKQIG